MASPRVWARRSNPPGRPHDCDYSCGITSFHCRRAYHTDGACQVPKSVSDHGFPPGRSAGGVGVRNSLRGLYQNATNTSPIVRLDRETLGSARTAHLRQTSSKFGADEQAGHTPNSSAPNSPAGLLSTRQHLADGSFRSIHYFLGSGGNSPSSGLRVASWWDGGVDNRTGL